MSNLRCAGGLFFCIDSRPNPAIATQLVRAKMLLCGYLTRLCNSGSSIINIVDHLNIEAQKVTIAMSGFQLV